MKKILASLLSLFVITVGKIQASGGALYESNESTLGAPVSMPVLANYPNDVGYALAEKVIERLGVTGHKAFKRYARRRLVELEPDRQYAVADVFNAHKGKLQRNKTMMGVLDTILEIAKQRKLAEFQVFLAGYDSVFKLGQPVLNFDDETYFQYLRSAGVMFRHEQAPSFLNLIKALFDIETFSRYNHQWPYYLQKDIVTPLTIVLESGVSFTEPELDAILEGIRAVHDSVDNWSVFDFQNLYSSACKLILSYQHY